MLFVNLSILSAALSIAVCVFSIYKRSTQHSAYFNLLSIAIAFYLTGNCVEVISQTFESSITGVQVAYIGIPFIPPLWYLCIRELCGKKNRTPFVISIMIIPVLIFYLAATWKTNHLLFSNFHYASNSHYGQILPTYGPLYSVKTIYLNIFNVLGLLTLLLCYLKGTKKFRQQALYFLITALIPICNTFTYLVLIDDAWVDITPYGLSLSLILYLFAHGRYGIRNYSSVIKARVIEDLLEGVIIFDSNGTYMSSNQAAKDIFPEMNVLQLGTTIEDMPYLPFDMTMLRDNESSMIEFTKESLDLLRTYNISISSVNQNGRMLGYCVIIHNITPIKNLVGQLEIKAHTDPLTGIYNRGFFFEKAHHEEMTARLARNPLGLIMFDLDFFKKINDTFGHACGDYVLRMVTDLGRKGLRKADVFGRCGGEEFCVLLPSTEADEARKKAEVLRESIANHEFMFEGKRIPVTASFGVASYNHEKNDESLEEMLKRADANLYLAKSEGRNRVIAEMAHHTEEPTPDTVIRNTRIIRKVERKTTSMIQLS